MDHSGTPERIDAHKLRRLVLSYRLKKTLQINDTADYWLIHWISPDDETPDDGSYVLLKYLDEDGKTVCACPASYESGAFWDLLNDALDLVINPAVILGWCYLPYDDRLPSLL
ncbi:MAG: hypothetical protein HFF30_10400 [Flavonifractor sp.]|jgi:hypothetical protein|nr:hypothetical protein [Flavonifractor sp.]